MPTIRANGIDLFYDEAGDPQGPALLLIMGLGTQMIAWPDPFCGLLADRGFRVVRFDNRDVGLSTKMDDAPAIDVRDAFMRLMMGQPIASAYSLGDMARDAVGLMDALGVARAHIVGASMGGMIAQIVAAEHGDRTRSLTSIMSSSGAPGLPMAKPAAMAALTAPRPPQGDREAAIALGVATYQAIGSPAYPPDEADLRARLGRAFDRSYAPAGAARQLVAVLADGSRVDRLKAIRAPTLVLHGADDPLAPVEGGEDTARHIPGAKLTVIPGWGHDLPAALLPQLADLIASHCEAADRAAG